MKIRFTLLAAILAALASSAFSQNYSIDLDLTFDTKYVFRGQQLADNVFHPSIEFAQDDLYLGLWAAQPLENRGWPEFWQDEVDFYGGYGWAINEKTSFDIGGAYYYYPTGDSTIEPYLGITREIQGIAASLYLYRDLDLDTTTAEGSANYKFPLSGKASVDLGAHFGTVEVDRQGSYLYYGADVVVPFELNDNAVFSVGVHYSDNDIGFLISDSHFHASTSIRIGF
jgi:uncharacterized protein (TIGR02001 family)